MNSPKHTIALFGGNILFILFQRLSDLSHFLSRNLRESGTKTQGAISIINVI